MYKKADSSFIFSRLQAVRPSVMPNEGFMAQLRLYGALLELGKMDSIVMRWYNLQRITKALSYCEIPNQDAVVSSGKVSNQSALKCKTCR